MPNSKLPSMDPIPPSVSSFTVNTACAVFFFGVLFALRYAFPLMDTMTVVSWSLGLSGLLLACYELGRLKVHRRPSAGLANIPGPEDQKRLVTKLIGLYGTMLLVLILYHLNPYYINTPKAADFFHPYFDFLDRATLPILISTLLYFVYFDRRQKDPYDGYWQAGCLFTGRLKSVRWIALREHFAAWFIKGFFLPIMFAALVAYADDLLFVTERFHDFLSVANYVLNLCYAVDVLFAVLGYILTVRVLDTHIRSTEPTALGWLVCLFSYHPFSILGATLFFADDKYSWNHWLAGHPALYVLCGGAIIFLTAVYALATVAIGYRMSNLTYRGLITSGPYRFTKHPAYAAKVTSWWLISMPFLSNGDPALAIKYSAGLVVISVAYYLRCRTEENHLSNYPEYVAYAEWINRHGLFAPLTRHFPSLQYSKEKADRWKSVVWFKKI